MLCGLVAYLPGLIFVSGGIAVYVSILHVDSCRCRSCSRAVLKRNNCSTVLVFSILCKHVPFLLHPAEHHEIR